MLQNEIISKHKARFERTSIAKRKVEETIEKQQQEVKENLCKKSIVVEELKAEKMKETEDKKEALSKRYKLKL